MRDIITIVESTGGSMLLSVKRYLKRYGIDSVPEETESYYGTDDLTELVEIISNDLSKLFKSGSATLYRVLNLPDETVAALKAGDSLGPADKSIPASWTSDYSGFDFDGMGTVNSVHAETNLYMIEAVIPVAALDLPLSIMNRIATQWEMEVSLSRGHPVQIVSIHRCDGSGHYDQHDEVRSDLRGARMIT